MKNTEATKGTEMNELSASDLIIVAQEMAAASRKYAESANRISGLEEFPGQFANAVSGQRQMSHLCNVIARKAGWSPERDAEIAAAVA